MNSANSQHNDIDQVSSSFSHDVSTPLATAKMNADLILEYMQELTPQIQALDNIPDHIKSALINAPKLISANVSEAQALLSRYKLFLNTLDRQDYLHQEGSDSQIHKTDTQNQTQLQPALKILLVDDEQIHHDIAESVLGSTHSIAHVYSGKEAIETSQQQEFDVVLMDMQMPGLSGKETTEKLCELIGAQTKIIGLTSMPIERQKVELKKSGFYDFLDKPLKQGMLEQVLIAN
ncbi:Signal transduction histidine-protein kinase BarA [Thalassocella blandensis]|nr:Signal transduction histidine-protein kinase BarA [Thalassocella blandensis]